MSTTDLTNQFLIAMPNLADPNFHHTVTYICAHNEDGAMGIVINRPMELALGDILAQMNLTARSPDTENMIIYQGGPVQTDRGFVLHLPDTSWHSSINVSDEIGVTTSRDILEAIAEGRGPADAFIALGYAGWAAGQLEQEIKENAWLSGPAGSDIIFNTPVEKRWEGAARLLGVDVDRLSSDVGHA